jgi:hypothetical protein
MNRNYKQTTIRLRETAVVGVKETIKNDPVLQAGWFLRDIAQFQITGLLVQVPGVAKVVCYEDIIQ